MPQLTFSNRSNAVRGFRQCFPAVAAGLDNDALRLRGLVDGNSIDVAAVADHHADTLRPLADASLASVVTAAPLLRRSAVGARPVASAHKLYASLPAGTSRADAIAAAVAQGIAYFTARTQYQRWVRAA